MMRSYLNPGWLFYMEFPNSGFLLEIKCGFCQNQATLLVEDYWRQYKRVLFMCRPCNIEIGNATFKKK